MHHQQPIRVLDTLFSEGLNDRRRDESLGTRGIGDEVFVALGRSNILALITSLLPSVILQPQGFMEFGTE